MAGSGLFSKYLNRLSPFWRRELGFFALLFGFGLLVMPFLIYFAGVLTLGPYEGGLLAFLGSLMGAVFTAKPSAWLLVIHFTGWRLAALASLTARNSLPSYHSGQVSRLATLAPTSNSSLRSSIVPLTSQDASY